MSEKILVLDVKIAGRKKICTLSSEDRSVTRELALDMARW